MSRSSSRVPSDLVSFRTLAALLALLIAAALPALAEAKKPRKLYVSLGDSAAVGVQQDATGNNVLTRDGYPRQLAKKVKGVKLVELGCAGATTESFINGGACESPAHDPGYENDSPETSQLATAERLLKKKRKRIAFVTIDIGPNDFLACREGGEGGTINVGCAVNAIAGVEANMPVIATRLRKAAGKRIPLATMTHPNPFLEQWFHGDAGKALAQATVEIARQVNTLIAEEFNKRKFKIARVAEAFDTYVPFEETTTYAGQTVPVAVAEICRLTAICQPPPFGPDVHPTDEGYALIATAFRKALGKAAR